MFSLLININKCNLIVKWYQERKKERKGIIQTTTASPRRKAAVFHWMSNGYGYTVGQ